MSEFIPFRIRNAEVNDLPAILALLKRAELPTEDVEKFCPYFLVAQIDEKVVGTAGMEVYGKNALVRSLAVAPEFQKRGIGKQLLNEILVFAKNNGMKEAYLLTHNIQSLAQKVGFVQITREEVPEVVQQSVEFRLDSCKSATVMKINLLE